MKRSELLKFLKKHGCYFSKNGSNHEKWISPDGKLFMVPRHSGQDLPKYLAEDILKQAGVK